MARQIQRPVHQLEAGPIAFYFGTRLLMRLGDRSIIIGRKRFTKRFWALVVDVAPADGELLGEGHYQIFRHDGHTHLAFDLDRGIDELNIPRQGSLIVTVMNPGPTVWEAPHPFQEELFDLDLRIPTPFPPDLQSRFQDRRYAQMDTVEFLDHPGTELVLISE